DSDYTIAHASLLVSQALSFTPKHQQCGTAVANLAIVSRAVGRGPDHLYVIHSHPTPELLGSRSHNRLLEERSHRSPDNSRIESVYAGAQEDESGRTRGCRRSHKRTEVPWRTNVAQRRPIRVIGELDLIECLDPLVENRCDARC